MPERSPARARTTRSSRRTDLPKAEIQYLDAGHFALETNAAEIAGYIREFMPSVLKARCAESCWPPSELLGLKRVDAWGSTGRRP